MAAIIKFLIILLFFPHPARALENNPSNDRSFINYYIDIGSFSNGSTLHVGIFDVNIENRIVKAKILTNKIPNKNYLSTIENVEIDCTFDAIRSAELKMYQGEFGNFDAIESHQHSEAKFTPVPEKGIYREYEKLLCNRRFDAHIEKGCENFVRYYEKNKDKFEDTFGHLNWANFKGCSKPNPVRSLLEVGLFDDLIQHKNSK